MHAASGAHASLKNHNVVSRLHELEPRRKASDAGSDNDDLLGFASRSQDLGGLRRKMEGATGRNSALQECSAAKHI
jgi:hypothetical protein